MNYVNEIAEVISTDKIAKNIYKVRLKAPKITDLSEVGQFVNILPDSNWEKAMRRPMSIAEKNKKENCIELIYKVFGEGTQLMNDWIRGDKIDIIGPLGNGWDVSNIIDGDKLPVLMGGGVGIAPIMSLYQYIANYKKNALLIMGARNFDEHFLNHKINELVVLSTDDGSLGVKGNVIDALEHAIDKIDEINLNQIEIFCCGPPMMMESVKKYSDLNNIDCQVALETIMACGFGICQGCTVEYDNDEDSGHSYRSRFGLVCLDGPVFNAKNIKTCKL